MLLGPGLWQGPDFMNQMRSLGMLHSGVLVGPALAERSSFAHFGFVSIVPLQTSCYFSSSQGKCHSPQQNRAGVCQLQRLISLSLVPPNHGTALTLRRLFLWTTAALSVCYLILESRFLASPCLMRLQNVVIQNTVRRCSAYMQQPDF